MLLNCLRRSPKTLLVRTRYLHSNFNSNINYFTVLEIEEHANDEAIKQAYLRLAKLYHPDVKPEMEHKFKEIAEAYRVLSDPVIRRQYLKMREANPQPLKKQEKEEGSKNKEETNPIAEVINKNLKYFSIKNKKLYSQFSNNFEEYLKSKKNEKEQVEFNKKLFTVSSLVFIGGSFILSSYVLSAMIEDSRKQKFLLNE